MSGRARTPLAPLFVICAAFFVFGLASLDDFGLTPDEDESARAAAEAWAFATGSGEGFSNHHAIPGYYFALDLSRAAFTRFVGLVRPEADAVVVVHVFHLCLATASLALVYLLAFEIGRSGRAAAAAATCLALMPAFVGHSQNNPKDLPALFTFVLVFWLLVRAVRVGGARTAIYASLALGLCLNTRILSLAVVPIFGVWLTARWPALARTHWRRLTAIAVGGFVVAFLLWPWAWADPLARISDARALVAETLTVRLPVLYLGRMYVWTNVPWHYTPFHLLVTTPLCLLLLIGLSAFAWRSARRCRPELVDLVWTGTVWVGSLLLIEQLATARYDGIRHYLMILVGASLLAGAGAEWVLQTVAAAVRAAKRPALAAPIAWATLGVLGLIVVLELVRAHPYESAYVNPVASLAAPRTEGWIELDYWGNSLKEGAAWLDRNAEPDARIHAPVLRHIARHYLGDRVSAEMPRAGFDDVSKPRYLLLLTRRAFYRAGVRAIVATREPVFAIRRGRGTLLEIYRNRAPRPSEL